MPEQESPIRAAIDIGSNTIHIVVAHCRPDTLDIIAEETAMVRIGESVNATGEISPQKQEEALTILQRYQEVARQHKAEEVLAVATEAIRKARNSAEFLKQVQQKTGLQVQIISGDAEAALTFYGATYELFTKPHPPAEVGVADVGGGSTELIIAHNGQITWRTSIPIGTGLLHDRYLPSNPPTQDELDAAETFLRTYLQGIRIPQSPPILIVTGLSALSLLQIAQRAFGLEAHSDRLTQEDLARCQALLRTLPAEEVAYRYEQHIERARILPAGVLILEALMNRLHLQEIHVSVHGLRHGVLLARERFGENWLQQVSDSPSKRDKTDRKNVTHTSHQDTAQTEDRRAEPFAQFGQRELPRYMKKFLKWIDEILKHQGSEPVHKMRVASRRLRALLDAYESLCKPKTFKNIYRCTKKLADLLGSVRDTDVMLQDLHTQLEQVPEEERAGVQWLIHRLEAYQQQRQQALDSALQQLDKKALKRQAKSCLRKGVVQNGKG